MSVNTTLRVDIFAGNRRRSMNPSSSPAKRDAADRSHRHWAHHRERADHADAAGVQPQFPGAAHHRAGASRPFRPHSEFYNSQESLSSNVNGQSRPVNNVQLEGADNSDNGGSLAFYIPSAEAIETVSVATSNYDAEFGSRRRGDERHH